MEDRMILLRDVRHDSKRRTRVQWLIEEDEQKELYDDLGIIGEISSPDAEYDTITSHTEPIHRGRKFALMQNCQQMRFETPSGNDINMDVKLKRTINRMQRKRTRKGSKVAGGLSYGKIGKMNLSNNVSTSREESILHSDLSLIGQLPDEVLLKVFNFCNSETRVQCSRVCWRWYHIVNDESLWRQVSMAKHTANLFQLQRMLKRGVKVLCLNCATISQSPHPHHGASSSFFDESSSSSLRPDPFSRAYHYCVHSLDFTNANVSPNTLCMILTRCNQLKNLSLEGLTLNHFVLGSLTSCMQLERLNLCLCHDMTMSGLTNILSLCNNLLELNIAWTNLCHSDPTQIVESLPAGLARLNMSGFRDTLRDSHVVDLVRRCPSLVEVDIGDSNLLTGFVIDQMIAKLSQTLKAINLSRCYSITPNCFLRFSRLPMLRYLDVFGVMDDTSISTLAAALPRVRVCLRPFSAIARPSPSALYGTKRKTVWGYLVV